ncbi:RNA-binding S4 domain-containing protein [Paramicrobacterium agarici]|uniref:Heat shock protein Hsp15 n=1 Tax=Paramicrobacterium agarici TaxID=630514 RepID=A0A2A9DXR4_9MICO|nr:S4 domain-containing protein [Microbacterium agarici]PFG31478.1 heat shock protein Hsp15 [Microbacterium agarici]TQO21366.1 heat shock protein Hsp15 [Microbacterium agarici]
MPAETSDAVRVDSWIWAVRLAKTRSAATTACKAGHVRVNGDRAKPAQRIRAGDDVRVRRGTVEHIVTVTKPIVKRVSAAAAAECLIDRTPPRPKKTDAPAAVVRERGAGRPTKRDRRAIDRLRGRP